MKSYLETFADDKTAAFHYAPRLDFGMGCSMTITIAT
jgi:hypothetical protein